ncbi:MAG: leucine-rich repeat protein [Alloprevotella sp.]|nr:leucine-rich repeat protein [Alloprevotella sp.]
MKHTLRKHFSFFFTACFALTAISQTTKFEVDGIYYQTTYNSSSNVEVVANPKSAYSGYLTIPSTVSHGGKQYDVVAIGNRAMANCTELKTLVVEEGITAVNDSALYHCTGLQRITLPTTLTRIGYVALNGIGVKKLRLPAFTSYCLLETQSMGDCPNLTDLYLDAPSSRIFTFTNAYNAHPFIGGSGGFAYTAAKGQPVTLHLVANATDYADEMPWSLFETVKYDNQPGITIVDTDPLTYELTSNTTACVAACNPNAEDKVFIPESVTIEGKNYIVTSIKSRALANAKIRDVVMPNTLTYIGDSAFYNCEILRDINIPNSVTAIGPYAFAGCEKATSLTLGNSVKSIGAYAFYNCQYVETLHIPASVRTIGEAAFAANYYLASITVDKANPVYSSPNGCNGIIETATKTLIAACSDTGLPNDLLHIGPRAYMQLSLEELQLPASVRTIGEYAFYGSSLRGIELPVNLERIEKSAFETSYLVGIDLPNKVKFIGERAFAKTVLLSIVFPKSLTEISAGVCADCSYLIEANIPATARSIGAGAFENVPFQQVYVNITDPSQCQAHETSFSGLPNDATLHVPSRTTNLYTNLVPWSYFKQIVDDAQPSTEPADLNDDGDINVGDVTTLVNAILGKSGEGADLNDDGSINVGDVTTLVNMILGK